MISKPQHHVLLFLPSFIFFFIIHSHCDNNTSNLPRCSTYDCGNGIPIKYPFWHIGDDSSDLCCGYPEFGLSCSNGEPVLTLPNDTYYVKDISYTDYTITLVDIDATGQTCPRARQNLTLQNLPLDHTNLDLNLTFYFNCSSSPFSFPLYAIGCLGYGKLQSYVIMMENQIDDVDWVGKCEEKVVVTVMKTEIMGNDLISGFGRAMNKGFMLDWGTVKYCGVCEDSGGFCGYNKTTTEFLCFCGDGTAHRDRCKGDGPNVGMKVGIGGAIMCLIFYIYIRRKRKPNAPSSFVSRSITSDFASKSDIERGGLYFGVPVFTYAELEEATNNFDSAKELGDGGKLRDGRAVAVKRLYENNYKRVEQFMNEVEILTRLRHPHLVSLYGHRHEINLSNMAINKIQSDTLHELVDHNLGFESDNATRIMITAVAELAFQCLQGAKEMRPSMENVLETLKEIQSKGYNIGKKIQEIDIQSDDVGLLKSCQLPRSPDTVMTQWTSSSTTSNNSS
ncbi:hypothetical protein GH714_024765 [Hevea brasiliensis]|uniref:non-specific serine/threonine protein kinase n=1 Tax=Hevea brasiliensis TaxID=3981 RepID=A0A6A6LDM0_HEVBR|nr:hypothetical protein GH714_024765 [Hevea brasiliensis]